MKVEEGTLLWTPPPARLARSHLTRYLRWLADRGHQFDDYEALWRWSVADLEAFWCSIAEFCGIEFSTASTRVLGKRTMLLGHVGLPSLGRDGHKKRPPRG